MSYSIPNKFFLTFLGEWVEIHCWIWTLFLFFSMSNMHLSNMLFLNKNLTIFNSILISSIYKKTHKYLLNVIISCLINAIFLIECRSVSKLFYNIFNVFLFTKTIFLSNSGITFEDVISSKNTILSTLCIIVIIFYLVFILYFIL